MSDMLRDVSTIKHKPNKLAEVFKIWGDFSGLSFIETRIA